MPKTKPIIAQNKHVLASINSKKKALSLHESFLADPSKRQYFSLFSEQNKEADY
jgi:hypothetical protein